MMRRWIWIVLAVILFGIPLGGLLLAWLGIYDVAASRGHWLITDRFLRFAMERAVKVRAPDMPPPPRLDDPDLIRLGAGHFQSGCAYCHGAPGHAINPISRQMLPPPPDLSGRVGEWSDQELFWIVKHGIKYAGMPAWPARQRDDEIWAVVAFLRKLSGLGTQTYRLLALGEQKRDDPNDRSLAMRAGAGDGAGACVRCHGAEGRAPASRLVPILHGQPADMLWAALEAYADGRRHSGVMQSIASDLTSVERQKLTSYYAGLPPPPVQPQPSGNPQMIDEGRRIATEGVPSAQVPACQGCHGSEALPLYPRLAGQNERYLASQLRLWKRGVRSETETSALMTPIGARLTEAQIDALAAYYARLPREAPVSKRAETP